MNTRQHVVASFAWKPNPEIVWTWRLSISSCVFLTKHRWNTTRSRCQNVNALWRISTWPKSFEDSGSNSQRTRSFTFAKIVSVFEKICKIAAQFLVEQRNRWITGISRFKTLENEIYWNAECRNLNCCSKSTSFVCMIILNILSAASCIFVFAVHEKYWFSNHTNNVRATR